MNTAQEFKSTDLDHWQCQQLLYRCCNLMDNHQWQALANCYTLDAKLARPSDPQHLIEGREAILASFVARPPKVTSHIISNCWFETVNVNVVKAYSNVWLMSSALSSTEQPSIAQGAILAGSFNDTLVKVEGHWLVQERRGAVQLSCPV